MSIVLDQISALVTHQRLYEELRKVIQDNPTLHDMESSFWLFFMRGYEAVILMGIRRQVKIDNVRNESVSLKGLLAEIADNCQEVRKKEFLRPFKGSTVQYDETWLDSRFGGACEHINPDIVRADITRLDTAAKNCEVFADQFLAHRQRKPKGVLVTHREMSDAVYLLKELVHDYNILIRNTNYLWGPTDADIRGDLQVFRVPWIQQEP